MQDVFTRLQSLVEAQLGVPAEEVTPDADFVDHLYADSLEIIELIMAVEEDFDIEIDENEAVAKIRTVQDAVSFIEGLQEARQ